MHLERKFGSYLRELPHKEAKREDTDSDRQSKDKRDTGTKKSLVKVPETSCRQNYICRHS